MSLLKDYRHYDPAARSLLEVLLLYPGIKAIVFYRIANFLWRLRIPFLPRFFSEFARFISGIEIHPAATIGEGLIIDHGMGVVVGETAIIGDHVIMYQGVSLGGTSLAQKKRHPTVGNHVVIGAGAKILGDITIGNHCRIGANSVVIQSIPDECTVVGIPAKIIARKMNQGEELNHDFII